MNPEREKLLNDTYRKFMDLMLGEAPLDSVYEVAVDNVMGYGTTTDEKIMEIGRLRQLVVDQRDQGAGIDISFVINPVFRRMSPGQDSALIVDEIDIKMIIDENENILPLRLGSVFEFIDGSWKVVHMHGSMGVKSDGDTWHQDELKHKMEELQKLVNEKTADLQNKNRELEIEAALERVRARAMAMQKSTELAELVATLFNQLNHLDFALTRCYIYIIDPESLSLNAWTANTESGGLPECYFIKYLEVPYYKAMINAWRKREKKFVYELGGNEKIETDKILFSETEYRLLPENVKSGMMSVDRVFLSFSFNNYGALQTGGLEPLSKENLDILSRFGKVFDQNYTRFLDLQKAEAQAREAQIEASLERVRSKTMSMQKSEELDSVVKTIFDEFDKLDLGMLRVGIGILNKEKRSADVWTTTITEGKNTVQVSGDESMDIHPLLQGAFKAWSKQSEFSYILEGEDLRNYYKALLSVNFKLPDSQSKISENDSFKQYYHSTFFKHGGLFAFRETPFSDESKIVMKKFADTINLTYTRFNDLLQAEQQNKIIQSENERKTRELEEARELQLAMLPKEIPQLKDYEIAVYMKTATEVGGDYYDFTFMHNGSVNIAAADATGHGMKAGTMVTMIKSLFTANSNVEEITEFFKSTNKAIKNSNLKRMMIAFAMLNIYGNNIKIINAGMPPVYHYKKSTGAVTELGGHNLPLGAMHKDKYNADKVEIEKGDVILMLSDGFPELQNENSEQYGYEKLVDTFTKLAINSADEILTGLKYEGIKWAGKKEQEDDITFVVIKVK